MRTVMWDVDTLDWTRIPPEEIRRRAVEGLHAGAVVLMHGINARTPEAVPLIVEDARRLGYDLVPVGDLPPAAPARTARAGGR